MTDWAEFEGRLAGSFREVTDRVYLIIASELDPTRYVQFASQPESLDAEAPGVDVVGDADESVLQESGWRAPTVAQPNWTSALALPALTREYGALAERCIAALRDAYGVTSPNTLAYRAWRVAEYLPAGETWSEERFTRLDQGTASLDFPQLGIVAM